MERILFCKIDESQHDTLLSYTHLFPLDFQEKLLDFNRWQDCQLSLMGRVMLRIGLQEISLGRYRWQDIRYTDFGKPFIDGPLHFSITHSGDFAACMISTDRVVGIDLEVQRPVDMSAFNNIFSTQELAILEKTSDNSEKLICFYDYWTLKEAVVKATGLGLDISLPSLDVSDRACCLFGGRRWYLDQSYRLPGYSFSVAADKPASPAPVTPVRQVSLQEALQTMKALRA